ncbi:hypothetical protein GF312_18720 [Candidatus Poribacteria bacterium]|nr:hypothetical protein [Candidatus Poribacteria bacterium]
MKANYVVLTLTLLFLCLVYNQAYCCMYNVRDVGFVDIDPAHYKLFYYVNNSTAESMVSSFRRISYASLMDSNVESQIINLDSKDDYDDETWDTAGKYLKFWELDSFPGAILVSPSGHSMKIPVPESGDMRKEPLWSSLEEIVISPKRREIRDSVVNKYCAVVFIQGKDKAKNEKALEEINIAISEIEKIMRQLPKVIEKPPRLIQISPDEFDKELVLLWGLGVEDHINKKETGPWAALIYGRGRRIGPILSDDEITNGNVYRILSLIGASCECGLDRKWMMGTMIPLRWDKKTQTDAFKVLGFDPESPMVKTEISQILAAGAAAQGEGSIPGLSGYREQVVELEKPSVSATVSPAQLQKMVSSSSDSGSEENRGIYRIVILVSGIMLVLILLIGLFIVLNGRRRATG